MAEIVFVSRYAALQFGLRHIGYKDPKELREAMDVLNVNGPDRKEHGEKGDADVYYTCSRDGVKVKIRVGKCKIGYALEINPVYKL